MNNDKRTNRLQIIIAILGGGGVCGIVIVLIQHFFFAPEVKTTQLIEMRKENVQSQYPQLKRLKMFAELGDEIATIIFSTKTVYVVKGHKEPYAIDSVGISENMPSVIYISTKRDEWQNLKDKIIEDEDVIDPEIYRVFSKIISLIEQHPWPPPDTDYDTFRKSPWYDKAIKGRWHSLNRQLLEMAERMLSLEK